jgi:hypothetical protein
MDPADQKTALILGACIVIITCILIFQKGPVQVAPEIPLPPQTIRQVDHLVVQVPDPSRVYHIFTGDLALPVAWPLTDYGSFTSGGVSFGNVNVEFLNSSPGMRGPGMIPDKDGFVGIAFQPASTLESTVPVLDTGRVSHGEITPFTQDVNGTKITLWNQLVLTDVMPDTLVFYCEYAFNQTAFRQRMISRLAADHGGPLGITGMKEITIGYADPAVVTKWQQVLKEAPGGRPEIRDGGGGVLVRLAGSDRNAILSVTLQVRSAETAAAVLKEKGLLGNVSGGRVSLRPDAVYGLQVFFTE